MAQSRDVMLRAVVVFVLCCAVTSVSAAAVDGPTIGYHGCITKEPMLEECMMNIGKKLFKQLAKGHKEFEIPIMDPLVIPTMLLSSGNDHVNMHLHLMNSTHRGLSTTIIKSIQLKYSYQEFYHYSASDIREKTMDKERSDPENYKFKINMTLPKYVIESTYKLKGKFSMVPIMGTGMSNITLNNVDVMWQVEGKPEVRDGKKYFKLIQFIVTIDPQSMTIELENLFNGNKQLGKTMNTFLNDNWQEVFSEMKPILESAYVKLLSRLSTKVFDKIPYSDIFPDMA